MKIPLKYQIFEDPVEVSDKDHQRLSIYLRNWQRLHEMMLIGVNAEDLRRMVIMELIGRRRKGIINRLLGRLSKLIRKEYERRIAEIFV
jgi:hypothetical protein